MAAYNVQVVAYWNCKFRTVEEPAPAIEMVDYQIKSKISNLNRTRKICELIIILHLTLKVALGNLTDADSPECGSDWSNPNDLQKAWGGYLAVAR